jgi:hypothetical protein
MAFLNFIESFFFISLAITFVLIILIVYHFKQRIVTLEQKYDTIFEIINNLVKEINVMRGLLFQRISPHFYQGGAGGGGGEEKTVLVSIPEEPEEVAIEDSEEEYGEDYDDDETDGDEDEDYDVDDKDNVVKNESDVEFYDDGDEYDDVDDTARQFHIHETPIEENLVLDNDAEIIHQFYDDEEIKHVSVSDQFLPYKESDLEFESDTNIHETEQFHVHKIDEATADSVDTQNNVLPDISDTLSVYRKMNISTLKATVITKGLCSDPSKMKKHELLKLLDSELL